MRFADRSTPKHWPCRDSFLGLQGSSLVVSQGDREVACPVPDFQTNAHTYAVSRPVPSIPIAANHLEPLNDLDRGAGQNEEKRQLAPVVRPSEISDGPQHGKRDGMIDFVMAEGDGNANHLQ